MRFKRVGSNESFHRRGAIIAATEFRDGSVSRPAPAILTAQWGQLAGNIKRRPAYTGWLALLNQHHSTCENSSRIEAELLVI